MSTSMAGEREKKHAGSRPGRGCKEEPYPGMDTTEDFMESRAGVISSSGHSGEEVGEVQPEPGKDQCQLSLPGYPRQDLASYFLVLPSIPGSGLST